MAEGNNTFQEFINTYPFSLPEATYLTGILRPTCPTFSFNIPNERIIPKKRYFPDFESSQEIEKLFPFMSLMINNPNKNGMSFNTDRIATLFAIGGGFINLFAIHNEAVRDGVLELSLEDILINQIAIRYDSYRLDETKNCKRYISEWNSTKFAKLKPDSFDGLHEAIQDIHIAKGNETNLTLSESLMSMYGEYKVSKPSINPEII